VLLPPAASFTPLPSVLGGVALNNKACEIVHECTRKHDEAPRPQIGAAALFSTLDRAGLRDLVEALEPEWHQAGHRVMEQGAPGRDAYWVARGELEATRNRGGSSVQLARLAGGSVFGEMALLSRSPRSATVVTLRPTIVVRVAKDRLDKVAQGHPEIAVRLGAYCRDRMVQNLLKTTDVLRVVPEKDLPALVARFKIVVFEQGGRLVSQDQMPTGLFLIASGEVAIVRREGDGDPLVLRSLGVGEVVGEVATILRRKTSADVLAVHPTVTLFLPTAGLLDLVRQHPSILAELYLLAVQRDEETAMILDEAPEQAEDVDLT
jgi:CRP-like cAMP-binding protein